MKLSTRTLYELLRLKNKQVYVCLPLEMKQMKFTGLKLDPHEELLLFFHDAGITNPNERNLALDIDPDLVFTEQEEAIKCFNDSLEARKIACNDDDDLPF